MEVLSKTCMKVALLPTIVAVAGGGVLTWGSQISPGLLRSEVHAVGVDVVMLCDARLFQAGGEQRPKPILIGRSEFYVSQGL